MTLAAPQVYLLKPIERIAASRYAMFRRCELREIWTAGQAPRLLPRHPLSILGTIAHKILEEASRGSLPPGVGIGDRWDQLVDVADQQLRESPFESGISPLATSAKWYQVVRRRTIERAVNQKPPRFRGHSGKGLRPRTGLEIWVQSKDGSIAGWIDSAQQIGEDIVLSDFKSGGIFEAAAGTATKVKDDLVTQIKLYAALYHATFAAWPTILQIEPLSGASIRVPFTTQGCESLLLEARNRLRTVNDRISSAPSAAEEFARPSTEACGGCEFRPMCSGYRNARMRKPHDRWPTDLYGKVWDINALQHGKVNLRITIENGETRIARALTSKRHSVIENLRRGDGVGVFNLKRSRGSNDLSEGSATVLYKQAV